MLCQARQQVQEERTRVRNQIEVLLEEGQIKLSAVVMAEMAFGRLRARTEDLKAALEGTLDEVCRGLLDQGLKRIEVDGQRQEKRQCRIAYPRVGCGAWWDMSPDLSSPQSDGWPAGQGRSSSPAARHRRDRIPGGGSTRSRPVRPLGGAGAGHATTHDL